MKLRGTQEDFVRRGVAALTSDSQKKEVLVAPVAYGKSICIANIVSRLEAPTLVIQPNKELLEQNYGKYTSYGYKASVFSASLNQKDLGDVTYATIQSLKNHHQDVKALGVKYLIVDECHLGTARGSTIDTFVKKAKINNVLGVTATPVILTPTFDGTMLKMMDRTSKNMFSAVSHVVQISELVEAGYWAPLVYDVRVGNLNGLLLNSTGAEYTQTSILKSYEDANISAMVLQAVSRLRAEGRKGILVFVPSVDEAKKLAARVPGSAVVHGKTKKKERTKIIEDFKSCRIDCVFNVQVLTAGFDHPQLDAIVLARPTASIALYYQMMGRGTRIHPKKANTKIVDLSGNTSKFGRIEDLNYDYINGYGWGMFAGETLLTEIVGADFFKAPTKDEIIQQILEEHRRKNTDQANPGDTKLWFGKHSGSTLRNTPRHYLLWMLKNLSFNTKNMISLKADIETYLKTPAR